MSARGRRPTRCAPGAHGPATVRPASFHPAAVMENFDDWVTHRVVRPDAVPDHPRRPQSLHCGRGISLRARPDGAAGERAAGQPSTAARRTGTAPRTARAGRRCTRVSRGWGRWRPGGRQRTIPARPPVTATNPVVRSPLQRQAATRDGRVCAHPAHAKLTSNGKWSANGHTTLQGVRRPARLAGISACAGC